MKGRKTTLFILLVIVAMCLASCKDKKKCWLIRSSQAGETSTKYFWGTEDETVAEIKRMEGEESCLDVTKTEEKSYRTMEDCLSHND
ncbi:MAG: hypothetical protein MJ002_04945 [Paludibacteraceae bacterium]|nr:hypothetical protein [Paludibacteraceae bacterium]